MNADIQLRGSFFEEVPSVSGDFNAVRKLNFDGTSHNEEPTSDNEGNNTIFDDAKDEINNTIRYAPASTPLPDLADFDPEKQQQVRAELLCQRFNNKRAILNARFDIIFRFENRWGFSCKKFA